MMACYRCSKVCDFMTVVSTSGMTAFDLLVIQQMGETAGRHVEFLSVETAVYVCN